MLSRKSFLLIELLVAITFFVLFVSAIAGLQFISLKTKSLVIRRMSCLSVATNCLEALRAGSAGQKNKDALFDIKVDRTASFAKVDVSGRGVNLTLYGSKFI